MEHTSLRKKQLVFCGVLIIALLLSVVGAVPNWIQYEYVGEYVFDPIFDMEVFQGHYEIATKTPTAWEWTSLALSVVALVLFGLYALGLFKKCNQKFLVAVVFGMIFISPVMLPLDIFTDAHYDEMRIIRIICSIILVSGVYVAVVARNEIKKFEKKIWVWVAAILIFAMDYSMLAKVIHTVIHSLDDTYVYAIALAADFAATIVLQIALLVFALREKEKTSPRDDMDIELNNS